MGNFADVLISPEKEGKEKHVPVIEAPAKVKAGEPFDITIVVGKDVPHPNTIEHHIKWIQVYARKGTSQVAAHVATIDLGPTFAAPTATLRMILEKSATVYALEYCNVHGVWENSVDIEVE